MEGRSRASKSLLLGGHVHGHGYTHCGKKKAFFITPFFEPHFVTQWVNFGDRQGFVLCSGPFLPSKVSLSHAISLSSPPTRFSHQHMHTSTRVIFRGIEKHISKRELSLLCVKYGVVTAMQFRNHAIEVDFMYPEEAKSAVEGLHGTQWRGRRSLRDQQTSFSCCASLPPTNRSRMLVSRPRLPLEDMDITLIFQSKFWLETKTAQLFVTHTFCYLGFQRDIVYASGLFLNISVLRISSSLWVKQVPLNLSK